MSTTQNKLRGRNPSVIFIDEGIGLFGPTSYEAYEMVKFGRKNFGFRPRNKREGGVVIRYKCSHLEAQRRFKMLLITKRMLR